ncbi:hypothetical protein GQ602_007318 [Ophiocordyceps camponoti-floridani]|uniref:Mid2 domain-containing protein n=1 Tax=Ophiocordyceps camponoti-floridani TaxID=2030778 RepID=A0A8H4Q165_9HYPO|nr:hypothetical protein GQ602_007318 [Ophiocordyceps camponoti-floridani]
MAKPSSECPRGTTFYACAETDFHGCCAVDPCRTGLCPDGGRKTDSGITHTVPNHSVVTVTRHTIVFSEAPSSSSAVDSDVLTTVSTGETFAFSETAATPATIPAVTPRESNPAAKANGLGNASISSGTIVGLVAGGVVIIALCLLLLIACKRHRRRRRRRRNNPHDEASLPETHEKNHAQQPMSAHTTGTQASGSDPFAPFGGRVDHQPLNGTFEMDGSATAPVELPAETDKTSEPTTKTYRCYRPRSVPDDPAMDPRANLNSKTDSGHAAYVNQWSHWRALEAEAQGS